MEPLGIPKPGDVLFYRDKSVAAWIIEKEQSRRGFDETDLIHAAIMISHRTLIQATTNGGVHFLDLSKPENFQAYSPAVVLRHPSFQNRADTFRLLLEGSYFYFEQGYDWLGALSHGFPSDQRSICSMLVARILSDTGIVAKFSLEDTKKQVFPAELFAKLVDADFELISAYPDPGPTYFSSGGDQELIERAMGAKRKANSIFSLPYFAEAAAMAAQTSVESLDFNDPFALLQQQYAFSQTAGLSVLAMAAQTVGSISSALTRLNQAKISAPVNWSEVKLIGVRLERHRVAAEKEIRAHLKQLYAVWVMLILFNESGLEGKNEAASPNAEALRPLLFILFVLTGSSDTNEQISQIRELGSELSSMTESTLGGFSEELSREARGLAQSIVNGFCEALHLITNTGKTEPEAFQLASEEAWQDFQSFHGAVSQLLED